MTRLHIYTTLGLIGAISSIIAGIIMVIFIL